MTTRTRALALAGALTLFALAPVGCRRTDPVPPMPMPVGEPSRSANFGGGMPRNTAGEQPLNTDAEGERGQRN